MLLSGPAYTIALLVVELSIFSQVATLRVKSGLPPLLTLMSVVLCPGVALIMDLLVLPCLRTMILLVCFRTPINIWPYIPMIITGILGVLVARTAIEMAGFVSKHRSNNEQT